jgi:outer membrane biosynthesis protein TonB
MKGAPMAEMEQIFKVMSDGLKTLSQAIAGIAEKVDQMAVPEKKSSTKAASPKPKAKSAVKKATKATKKKAAKAPKKKTAAKKKAKPKAAPKKTVKTSSKPRKQTVMSQLDELIAQYPKGVDSNELKEKSGLDHKQIHNAVYKLKKQGRIKSLRKGIYVSTS